MTETVLSIISVLGVAASIVFGYLSFHRGSKQDSEDEGKLDGTMLSDIGYIKSGVDDIKREQREQRRWNEDMIDRMAAVEQSAKQAHHRIDRLEGRHDQQ